MRRIMGTVLLLAALTGCTDPFEPIEPLAPIGENPPVEVKSADPPTRFTDKPSSELEISTDAHEVLLHGLTAIVPAHGSAILGPGSGEELRLVDTRTGKTRQAVKPSHPLPKFEVVALPTLVTLGGRATVLMPFLVETPAQGTTPGRPLIEVVSVDPDSGEVDWRVEIPLDGWTPPGAGGDTVEVSFAGVADGVGMIRLEQGTVARRTGDSYALDLSTRTVLWRQAGYESRAVAGGVVVGLKPGAGRYPDVQVLGLEVRTGRQKWASSRTEASLVDVRRAGPALAVVVGDLDGTRYMDIVDIASGRTVASDPEKAAGTRLGVTDCVYDEQAITICYDSGNWIGGLDAKTGSWLWTVGKSDGRLIPRLTGAWHGVFYGWVDNLRPVVLDARTGADREADPGIAPSVVNESMAIGPWPGGSQGSSIYPVLG
jgi:hypothetical protein